MKNKVKVDILQIWVFWSIIYNIFLIFNHRNIICKIFLYIFKIQSNLLCIWHIFNSQCHTLEILILFTIVKKIQLQNLLKIHNSNEGNAEKKNNNKKQP